MFLSDSSSKPEPTKVVPPTKKETPEEDLPVVGSPLLSVVEFMKTIICGSSDGRVVLNLEGRKSFVKFLLLNPASKFHDIVKECRYMI